MDPQARHTDQLALVTSFPDIHVQEQGADVNAKSRDKLAQALIGLGAGPVEKKLGRIVEFMAFAEDEIAKAKRLRPERAKDIHDVFKLVLWQSEVLPLPQEAVYRAHVREIIDRVVNGRNTSPGTKAEALMTFSEASLKAPLNQLGLCCMQRLFAAVMEEDIEVVPEPYQGAAHELTSRLISKLSCDRDITKLLKR